MKVFSIILLLICRSFSIFSQESSQERNVRTFINLLDYIGSDYHNAVLKGDVINTDEFAEMNEFAAKAVLLFENISQTHKISNSAVLNNNLLTLKKMVADKSDKDSIFVLSNLIKSEILKLKLIRISPPKWPDITKGKIVFQQNCTSCHGNKGDGNGETIKNLNPKPSNFLDENLMNSISPLQIYNTMRLGITGTAMPSFNLLSDAEVWDAAFYVSSLHYKNKQNLSDKELLEFYKKVTEFASLEETATMPDKLLRNKFPSGESEKYLAGLRLYRNQDGDNVSIDLAISFLDKTLSYYEKKDYGNAGDMALQSYLQGIEPFEKQLQSIDSKLNHDLESIMFKLRSDINGKKPLAVIQEDISRAKTLINNASTQLGNNQYTFWFAFLMAATIILREGIEAFLIIITILGVLKSINADKARIWVHGGWITALVTGLISMFAINLIISFGAQSRELIEGIGSVIAVILLLYIGFWLHSKTAAKKWKEFIEKKIIKLVDGKNMIGLAIVSFVVVFREAFESAIFLSAVNIDVSPEGKTGMYTGAAISLVFVLILARIGLIYASKLPIRQLFKYSAVIMVVLSVVIAGKGIRAFQESGFSSVTNLPGWEYFDISILGIFPTFETIAAQLTVTILAVILWNYSKRIPKLS